MPSPRMQKLLEREMSRKEFLAFGAFAVASIFGIVGLIRQLTSHAATPAVSTEAEDGTVQTPATIVTDSTASGGGAVKFGSTTADAKWTDANPPWALKASESVDDNRPAGVNVISYDSYSNNGARSFGQTLAAIRTAATAPYYVRMSAGTFHVTDFSFASSTAGQGKGYQDVNATKYFGGLIGAGADKTFVVVDPNIMTSTQYDAVASGTPSPVAITTIYAGGSALTIPTFFSGITFRGNFQQSVTLSGLSGTAPAPYSGLSLTSAKPGSFIQFCRFQGFAFAAKNSPPYELGAIGSTHSSYTTRRVEIDGRLAKEINAAQPVSSGGLMWNYENNVKVIDSWLHHTRRSGWAMHDHATSEGGNASDPGIYYGENFQTEHQCDTTDGYAGSSLGFACSNVEEMRQSFTYVKPRFNLPATTTAHISIATSNGNTMANSISITDPIIEDNAKGGCLIVRIVKKPNSTGTSPFYSPYFDTYTSGGFAALPITVTQAGTTLTPILSTSYNATTHTPNKYYVVIVA